MTIYDKLFLAGYFLAVILIQCLWQRALINRNKPINHFWHGVVYAGAIGIAVWMYWPLWWQPIVIGVVTRLAWFEFMLNILRSKPLFYNGAKEKKPGKNKSLQDWVENHLSAWAVKVLKVIYVIGFILTLIFIK